MLGAALGAPMLPAAGAAAPAAGLSKSAFDVAVAHAQKFPVISTAGLSKHGKLTAEQAEAMIKWLASEGKVKLIGPSRSGAARAASRILTNDPWGIARTAQERQAAATQKRAAEAQEPDVQPARAKVAPWLAHVQDICRQRGMTLSPRCFA